MKNNTLVIQKAKYMGFCFGVKEAIDKTNEFLDNLNQPIYVLGMIVHNEFVIQKLLKQGVIFLSEADVLLEKSALKKDDVVIVRAHGTTKAVYEKLKKLQVNLIDMACLYVKNARNQLQKWQSLGFTPIFIGDSEHPEVKGITSYAKEFLVYENLENLKSANINKDKKWVFLFQTTYNQFSYSKIASYIEKEFKNAKILKTICGATYQRQTAVQDLAKNVDAVFIIGSEQSSNTKKLYAIAKEINESSYLITTLDDITKEMLIGVEKIGISAGASTPNELIKLIEKKIIMLKNTCINE